ncbi:hypothetical protein BKE38_12140 [Pseudoroseomonas deserti]|uniref:Terminase n=1 Tax=Teichococcus deserti TaxID=1817963 RepID=A0A1V2H262_9PROT|nr:hypothetical protein [Pseudoroseomonas deserti]ONG53458.1 hypothetical protein BKE38_12140 [Pseudoroseomonas deserti]
MAKGGFRPGAGRPKGAATRSGKGPAKAKVKAAEKVLEKAAKAPPPAKATAAEEGQGAEPSTRRFASALDFAMEMINDPQASMDVKVRLAVAALPFQHPKLEGAAPGKKEQRQQAAEAAAGGKFAPPAPPKLVVDNGG